MKSLTQNPPAIHVAYQRSVSGDPTPVAVPITFTQFTRGLRHAVEAEHPCDLNDPKSIAFAKNGMMAVIPARLSPEKMAARRARGETSARGSEVVEGSAVIGLDIDGCPPDKWAAAIVKCAGMSFASHTSPTDGLRPDVRKGRIYALLDREATPEEIWPLRCALAEHLGVREWLDPQTKDASRIFFAGRLQGTLPREFIADEGHPVPADALLAKYPQPVVADEASGVHERPANAPVIWTAGAEHEDMMTPVLVALLEGEYARGGRHKKARALGAVLAQAGWSDAGIATVVGRLPSDKVDQRVEQALDAAKLARAGERVHQLGTLREVFGLRLAKLTVDAAKQPEIAELEAHAAQARAAATEATPATTVASPSARDEKRSDLGNARRLVRLYGANLRHCAARDMWLVWDGSRWREDETGEAMRLAKESASALWDDARAETDDEKRKAGFGWAVQCQNAGRLEAAVKLAKTEPGIAVRVSELDADPWLLNVRNGTLDLRTVELRAPDRGLLMTKCCGAEYKPGARSALWESFIARTFGGDTELTKYVQRALGYALFGAWREKAFWFGYGPADGAKSTFFGVVGNVLGDYCMSAAASTWMVQSTAGGNRGDLVRLLGARLVTTSEIRESMRVDEENVKRVTGGDPIVAAAKYEGEIQFKPSFALWWFANDPPIIRDDDGAMWSRARVVPFTRVVPKAEQIKDLAEQLSGPKHAPAVLAWLVAGCRAWQRDGLGTCAAVDQATSQYRTQMNRLAGFADECIEVTRDPADVVPARRMRDRYEAWCRSSGVRVPLNPRAFASRLRDLGAAGGDDASKRKGKDGTADRMWFGVRLADDPVTEFVAAVTGGDEPAKG